MCVAHIVTVPTDGEAEGLAFPNAGVADELDYTFDFGFWLGPLDRVANAFVVPSPDMPLCTVTVDHGQVIARLGPAPAAGTYSIGSCVVTPQGRVKSVARLSAPTCRCRRKARPLPRRCCRRCSCAIAGQVR